MNVFVVLPAFRPETPTLEELVFVVSPARIDKKKRRFNAKNADVVAAQAEIDLFP